MEKKINFDPRKLEIDLVQLIPFLFSTIKRDWAAIDPNNLSTSEKIIFWYLKLHEFNLLIQISPKYESQLVSMFKNSLKTEKLRLIAG